MTAPATATQQIVSIKTVDVVALTATGQTRQGATCHIDLRYMQGSVHTIPSKDDQWIIKRLGMSWALMSQLPFSGTELNTLADNPQPGTVQIGSTNPLGLGPLHLNGSLVSANAPLNLGTYTTLARPLASSVPQGTIIYDTDLNQMFSSDGAIWTAVGTGTGGGGGTVGVAGQSIFGEAPSGVKNGSNLSFTTAQNFVTNSTVVFRNGVREMLNVTYTEVGLNGIHFSTAPLSDDQIIVDYLGPSVPTATSIFGETPTGSKDGINQTFTLAHTYIAGSISLYRNSLREQPTTNYTEVPPNQIHLTTPPLSSDDLTVDYLFST